MNDVNRILEYLHNELITKEEIIDLMIEALNKQHNELNSKMETDLLDKMLQEKERLYMKLEKVDIRINELLTNLAKEKMLKNKHPKMSTVIETQMARITEKGLQLEMLEVKTKSMVKQLMAHNQESVKSFRQKKGVINEYNKNMGSSVITGTSYFMDKKK